MSGALRSFLAKFPKRHVFYKGRFKSFDDVTLRLTDHSDYENILSVSKGIYNGLDYIPAKYHFLLNTENAVGMICFVGERAVSFVMLYEYDTEEPLLGLAARLTPQYRHTGLFFFLNTQAENIWKQVYGKRWIWSVGAMNQGRQHMLRDFKMVIELSWKVLYFKMNVNKNSQATKRYHMQPSNKTELRELFKIQTNLKVFKFGLFTVNRPKVVYKATLVNLLKVCESNEVLISKPRIPDSNEVTGVSFASSCSVPYGRMHEIFYYGVCESETLLSHIISGIHILQENCSSTAKEHVFAVYFPEAFSESIVEEMVYRNEIGVRFQPESPVIMNAFRYRLGDMETFMKHKL